MANQPVYKVIFQNGNQVFEVFARQIYQSDMWGFIEVEEFVFGERSQIVVDPSEEKLKNEFNGVKRSYIPLQAIIRIDEVDKEGSSKISDDASLVAVMSPASPSPVPILASKAAKSSPAHSGTLCASSAHSILVFHRPACGSTIPAVLPCTALEKRPPAPSYKVTQCQLNQGSCKHERTG